VLTAFQQVEDNLAALRILEQEAGVQASAVEAAERSLSLSNTRYEGGVTSYLEVLDADTRLFDAELGLAQAQLSELSALVEMYRALGGGWQT